MKRLCAATLILGTTLIGWRDVIACGDKFMIPGRGMTFLQAYKPTRPASVVIYAPSTNPADIIASAKVESLLAFVGHRVTTVRDDKQLSQRLATTKTDIVLTDWSEAALLLAQAQIAPNRPTIVPVMAKVTKAEAEACKKQYTCQTKTDKPEQYLATIETVMKQRAKASPTPSPNN